MGSYRLLLHFCRWGWQSGSADVCFSMAIIMFSGGSIFLNQQNSKWKKRSQSSTLNTFNDEKYNLAFHHLGVFWTCTLAGDERALCIGFWFNAWKTLCRRASNLVKLSPPDAVIDSSMGRSSLLSDQLLRVMLIPVSPMWVHPLPYVCAIK